MGNEIIPDKGSIAKDFGIGYCMKLDAKQFVEKQRAYLYGIQSSGSRRELLLCRINIGLV